MLLTSRSLTFYTPLLNFVSKVFGLLVALAVRFPYARRAFRNACSCSRRRWQCTGAVQNSVNSDIPGLQHIVAHHGQIRSDVYRRLFGVLWFGNKVGMMENQPSKVHTYPVDLLLMIRQRFSDVNAGRRDAEFASSSAQVYNVTWDDVIAAKWPMPPKTCKLCTAKAKKPY
jgi:hypothetical protein